MRKGVFSQGNSMSRKGVTPVIAVILLMVITVVAAGGAFAFIQQIQGGFEQDIQKRLDTEVRMRSVVCHSGTADITATILNVGKAQLTQVTPVSVFVEKQGSKTVMIGEGLESEPDIANMTEWQKLQSPDSVVRTNVSLKTVGGSQPFQQGTYYNVEVLLPGSSGQNLKVSEECIPS